jgi:hypothetical protein
MDVLLLVEMREFLVRLVRQGQTAAAAAGVAGIETDLIALSAVTAAD